MANKVHTIHRGPSGRYYAFGSEKGFLFYDGNVSGGSNNLFNGAAAWNGALTFGNALLVPAPLWFVSRPALSNARDYTQNQDIYNFEISGQWRLSYGTTCAVAIGPDSTFSFKFGIDGIWSPYLPVAKGTIYPLKYGLNVRFYRDLDLIEGTTWSFTISAWAGTAQYLNCVNFDDKTYFSGPDCYIHCVDNNLVQTNIDTKINLNFSDSRAASQFNLTSTSMFELFEHLVLVKDNFVQWSDLRNFWSWIPKTESEADYKILGWKSEDTTWSGTVGDTAFIHFPTGIHVMRYVGRPRIMKIDKLPEVMGCAFKRCLTVYNGIQFYLGIDGFYSFAGDGAPENIGFEIFKTFQNKVEPQFLNKTFAFLDVVNNIVGWAFVSAGTNAFVGCDRAVVYNYVEKHWTFISLNNVFCHCVMAEPVTFQSFAQSSGTITGDTGSIVDEKTPNLINLWGASGQIQRDEKTTDATSDLLMQVTPYLETTDLLYDTVHDFKDNDLVILDGDYDSDCVGVDVYVSVRDFLSAPVTYTLMGRWTKTMVGKQLDYQPVAGRIYRFKFVPIGGANGLRDFRFYAWGERVLLPNNTIGPEQ